MSDPFSKLFQLSIEIFSTQIYYNLRYSHCKAKINKIKEQIGWLANSYDKSDVATVKIYLCLFAIILISIGIVFTNKKALSSIDELGEL